MFAVLSGLHSVGQAFSVVPRRKTTVFLHTMLSLFTQTAFSDTRKIENVGSKNACSRRTTGHWIAVHRVISRMNQDAEERNEQKEPWNQNYVEISRNENERSIQTACLQEAEEILEIIRLIVMQT